MMYNSYVPAVAFMAENSDNKEHYRYMNFDKLSNRELLAILTRSDDDCEDSNLKQADLLLNYVNGDLNKLAWLSLPELLRIKGIRYAKALALACANTLLHKRTQNNKLRCHQKYESKAFYKIILEELIEETNPDSFWLFLFDVQGKFQNKTYLGNNEDCLEEHHKILQIGLKHQSCSLLLIKLSNKKHLTTAKETCQSLSGLSEAANMLSMKIVDYILTDSNGYYSCRDLNWLNEYD